jgi:hypothetical protein
MLISAKNLAEASAMARKRNLKFTDWVFIPWDTEGREKERRKSLMGQRVSSPEELIGYFTGKEKTDLLRDIEQGLGG